MRFHANKAERALIFRTVYGSLPATPRFCVRIWAFASNALNEVTEAGHTNATDPRAFISTQCEALYINRPGAW
jgi:hypothetical protein